VLLTPFLDGEAFRTIFEIVIMYANVDEQYTSKNKRSVIDNTIFIFREVDLFKMKGII
jgi:uncharacterized protein YfbU (UPF0304 family)